MSMPLTTKIQIDRVFLRRRSIEKVNKKKTNIPSTTRRISFIRNTGPGEFYAIFVIYENEKKCVFSTKNRKNKANKVE